MQYLKKIQFVVLLAAGIVVLQSCKSKARLVSEGTAFDNEIPAVQIIDKYNLNALNFSTLSIKAAAKYQDDNQSQNVMAEIRMKKDEKIMVIIRVLGITMAKALITPESVKYYDKIGNKFFEGDYSALSQWLGTDLNYQKVQSIFLGKTIEDLHKGKYKVAIADKWYQLYTQDNPEVNKSFYFESDNYLVKKQEIKQPTLQRTLQVTYPEYRKTDEKLLPLQMVLEAQLESAKTFIDVEYKNVNFNEDLSFPYNVPDGFERIELEKK